MLALTGLAVFGCGRTTAESAPSRPKQAETAGENAMNKVVIRLVGPDGRLAEPTEFPKLILSDAEWRKRLTPEQYRIARGKDTERPFCGGLLHNKASGVYACVCCNLPLFQSAAKFESGTGWPSFFQPMAKENILERPDQSHGMTRTEILCARCDAHLGHVFDDGPPPTGRRYCLNSEVLRFVPEDQIQTLAEPSPPLPDAVSESQAEIVLAGGCFWCVEAVFEQIDGVLDAVSGYAGGTPETANYPTVSTGRTGHAEAVKITYDPRKVSFEQLLKVHFATHDPTTKNRQGADVGPQYRSAVFYANDRERQLAEAFLADLADAKVFKRPIMTTLEPLTAFYPAEAKHQDFVACYLQNPYVRSVALPKVEKVRSKFHDLVKPEAKPQEKPDAKPQEKPTVSSVNR